MGGFIDGESPIMLYNKIRRVAGAKNDIFALFCTWAALNSTQYCDKCHSSACTLVLIKVGRVPAAFISLADTG